MERQPNFTRAILNAQLPVPDGLLDGQSRPAGRRFNVYRNNVAVSLTEALEQGFPIVTRLIGEENMKGLAGLYLRAHPPSSPLMMHYGAEFPAFIEELKQLSHLGYLGDVARLELALRQSYHAADAPALDPLYLGTLIPDALMHTRLALAPSAILLRSHWPIWSIWHYNTTDGAEKPTAGGQNILICRPDYDPIPLLLPPGAATWLAAISAGETLSSATEAAAAASPDFDLGATLALLIEGQALTDPPR